MDLLPILAAYGTAALIIVILAAALLAGWRGDRRVGSVLLERVLRRQSDAAAGHALACGSRLARVAAGRLGPG